MSPEYPLVEQGTAIPDGSRLCLACGLCCQGVLHDSVRLHPEAGDIEVAGRLGLKVETQEEVSTFPLPCPYHGNVGCSTYKDRPATCHIYRCKLLDRYLEKEVGWEDALSVIGQVKALLVTLRNRLGFDEPAPMIRQRIADVFSGSPRTKASGIPGLDDDFLMDGVTLLALCQKHFRHASGRKIEAE